MPWPFAKKPIQTETKTSVSEVQMMHPDGHDYALNDWRAYAKEGYKQNPTVYRCISLIAKNAASVRPYLKRGEEYIEDHPLLDLLQRPNPITGGQEFREEAYSWALLTGNIFCDRSIVGGRVAELHHWQPYGMKIHRSKANIQIPHSYEAENKRTWEVDAVSGASDMMHERWQRMAL
jgi:phage portal protein BeeE